MSPDPGHPAPWRDVVRIEKPFDEALLLGGLRSAITRRPSGPVMPDALAVAEPSRLMRNAWETIRRNRDRVTGSHILTGQDKPRQAH